MTAAKKIAIEHWMAPLSDFATHQLIAFLQHKGSPWVDDIWRRVRGETTGAEDHFFIALDDARTMLGHAWYTVSRADRRLGLIGHVLTHPDYRRRGIARQLLQQAMNEFHNRGGEIIQLFTSTLYSLPFYEQLGFENLYTQQAYHDRDWYMRSPCGSDHALRDWFAPSNAVLRPLAPADLPQYCLLYNAQHDHVLKDWAQRIGSGLEAELAFIGVTEALAQGRGAVCVVDNRHTIVAAASLIPHPFPHQSHLALFDVYFHSAAQHHAYELARQCLVQQDALQVEQVYALAADNAKSDIFAQLGFRSRGVLRNHYRIAEQRLDCELFELAAV